MIRVTLLTSNPYNTASRCLPELVASDRIHVVAVFLAESSPSRFTWNAHKRKIKKAMKIGILGALNGIRIRPWFRSEATEHIESLCERWSVPLHRLGALDTVHAAELFKTADADLGLSLGNGYIPRRIFSLPRLGMINFHGERLPEYQNAQSIIWPIYNMECTTGFTIHEVDDKIDTGRILYQEEYPIEFHATLKATVMATTRQTSSKVARAVRYVCENYDALITEARLQANGKSYTTPSFTAFLKMARNNKKLYKLSRATGRT